MRAETDGPGQTTPTVQSLKRIGSGLRFLRFPIMLLVGFVTHPKKFNSAAVTDNAERASQWLKPGPSLP
ncbi:hypothetical protein [Yoonia sp.]|uniref:hypothetical protein n=1 Tax=Yoonia sp. TaxID=2212373 RepID=UPI0035C7A310